MEFLGLTMNEDFPDSINEKGLLCSCPETEKKGSENKPCFYDICNMEIPKLAGSVIKPLLKEKKKMI